MPALSAEEAIARARAALGKSATELEHSLTIYYGNPVRDAAMDKLYATFLKPGDLAFDIGSHVGDRVASFRRLGARVVALEPQPLCASAIRAITGSDMDTTLVQAACGAQEGFIKLHVNSANPTVTTASPDFVQAAQGADGWEGQVWDQTIDVAMTTLDTLIAAHGAPAFIKVDVEGFEEAVLQGLSAPVAALSFEFTTIQRDVAYKCLERLSELGYARFNVALGESQKLVFQNEITASAMSDYIAGLSHEANSGDVYAIFA